MPKAEILTEIREEFDSTNDPIARGSLLFLGVLATLEQEDLEQIFDPELIERIRSWEVA